MGGAGCSRDCGCVLVCCLLGSCEDTGSYVEAGMGLPVEGNEGNEGLGVEGME